MGIQQVYRNPHRQKQRLTHWPQTVQGNLCFLALSYDCLQVRLLRAEQTKLITNSIIINLKKERSYAMKKVTFKMISECDNWIITKAKQGFGGKVRIDARTRFHVADGQNFYSEWLSITYVNRIRRENGLCPIQDRHIFEY